MLFHISLLLISVALVNSFTSNSRLFGCTRLATPRHSTRTDSSDAVKAALEASKKFGATSKEARLAWYVIEILWK